MCRLTYQIGYENILILKYDTDNTIFYNLNMPNYSLVELEDLLITQGVCDLIGKEFAVKKGNYPKKNIISLVDYILNYLETENKIIKDSETFGYGCWIIQFVYNGMYIELHELKEGGRWHK